MIHRLGLSLIIATTGWVGVAVADNEPLRGDADACQPDIHRL